MGLPIRKISQPQPTAPAPSKPAPSNRPTRGQLQVAATRFAKILDQEKAFARKLFEFAISELGNAWALLAYAHLLVRCQRANLALEAKTQRGLAKADAILAGYEEDVRAAKERDEADVQAASKQGKDEIARDLLLEDIPDGRSCQLSNHERQIVIDQVRPMFNPPSGTGPAEELAGIVVGLGGRNNLGLALWLIETFSDEDELAEFNRQLAEVRRGTAKDAAAARREAAERVPEDDGEFDGDALAAAAG